MWYVCALHSSDVTNALRAPWGVSSSVCPSIPLSVHTHTDFMTHSVQCSPKSQPLESASCHYIPSVVCLYVMSCNIRCHIYLCTSWGWCYWHARFTFPGREEQRNNPGWFIKLFQLSASYKPVHQTWAEKFFKSVAKVSPSTHKWQVFLRDCAEGRWLKAKSSHTIRFIAHVIKNNKAVTNCLGCGNNCKYIYDSICK